MRIEDATLLSAHSRVAIAAGMPDLLVRAEPPNTIMVYSEWLTIYLTVTDAHTLYDALGAALDDAQPRMTPADWRAFFTAQRGESR